MKKKPDALGEERNKRVSPAMERIETDHLFHC